MSRTLYSEVNKLVKNSVKKDDEKWASNRAKKLQDASSIGNQHEVWHNIKVLSGRKEQHLHSAWQERELYNSLRREIC